MRYLLALALLSGMLAGCATVRQSGQSQAEILDSWKGHHYSELIQSWGPPTHVYDNGLSGVMLVYSEIRQVRRPNSGALARAGMQATSGVDLCSQGGCDPASGATVTAQQSYDMLYVNPQGTIYNWQTNRASQAEARSARHRNTLYVVAGAGVVVLAMILTGGE